MKDIEKSRLNIAMKLIIGLGSLISISIVVGILAIFGMLSVQGNSAELADQFLPEISMTNEIERQTLKLMFDIRGFSLSLDESYYQNGQKDLVNLEKALNDAQALQEKASKLNDLKEALPKAKELFKKYGDLIATTKQMSDKIDQARLDMDKNAAEFITACNSYLSNQNESLNKEVGLTSRASLLDRVKKVHQGNIILDLGNNIRVGNFKTQALRDASYLDKVMGNFDQISNSVDELLKTTVQEVNQKLLNQMKDGAANYKTAALLYLTTSKYMDELAKVRADTGNQLSGIAEEISLKGVKVGQGSATMNQIIVTGSQWTIIIGLLFAMGIGVIIAMVLIRAITKPLNLVTALSKKITMGNFEIQKENIRSHDELGQLIVAFYEMVDGLKYKAKIIESIAGGNLTNDIQLASDEDGLGRSLRQMQDSLNEILTQVNIAVEQMASGADQVSTAAQSLSQGATEQASSLEEISASSNEIHSQSKRNAETALSANQLAKQASVNAQKGNAQMTELMSLLEKMTKSSEETKKIVKTIDDIAFQVNLLALNANVEAARAGKYGKGFAVVAEEVRNLAVRSGVAVRETTQMVEENLKSIREVNVTAQDTGTQLTGILEIANKVADFLEEIAAASQEQARAMGQINGGLDQIDQVTQSNTASAEESASASEELSGQAQQLKAMVSRFQLNDKFLNDARMKSQKAIDQHEHKNITSVTSKVPRISEKKAIVRPSKPAAKPDDIILNDDFDSF